MRAFSTVFILAALALTANASIMYSRALATGMEKCAIDLTEVESSMAASTKALNDLNAKAADLKDVKKVANSFVAALGEASNSCCSPGVIKLSEDDLKYAFVEAGKFVNKAEPLISALTGNKDGTFVRLNSVFYYKIAKNIRDNGKKSERCLVERSPKDKNIQTTEYTDKLTVAIEKLKALNLYVPETNFRKFD